MGSDTYHEPLELLSEPTKDMHRAIVSLCEELEAVDWYQQRAEATKTESLRAVLTHNKNEEIEHAMMNLEWIRRNSPEFDEIHRHVLADDGADHRGRKRRGSKARPAATRPKSNSSLVEGSLGIGSLKA